MEIWKPIDTIVKDVQNGRTTAQELVERAHKAIETAEEYKAVIAVIKERAIKRAKDIDSKIAKGQSVGRLAGIPFIAKDNFLAFGADTTAASNILKGFEAPYQSTAIERLEAEGAICVAKANLDAFAHGSSTENSDYMTTLNPHDKTRVPGGSSGGSAAAIALNLVPFTLGTDTGGSIRLPASYCGVVGYKPSYGLVSRSGVIAMASSTDTIGPLARSVEDAALVLDVMSGPDELDATTIQREDDYTALNDSLRGKTVGVIDEYFTDQLDEQVKSVIASRIDQLKKAGASIRNISLPSLDLALACYYIIVPAEISSNLSRYDGQRYGFSYKDAKSLTESYEQTRSIGFGDEAKRRIMLGTYVLSSGYYDAYYKKAQQLRTKLIEECNGAFDSVDFLLGPTAPSTAFKIGENEDPMQMYLTDIMTVAANLIGIPAISIPAGEVNNLPVGLQLMAPQKQDKALLTFAKNVQELII